MIVIKSILKLGAIVAITLTFSSCSLTTPTSSTSNTKVSQSNKQSVQVKDSVKIPTTKEIVNTLASNEFEGRYVGSKGNEKAGQYISGIFKDIGLKPLLGENYYVGYTQPVYKHSGMISADEPINGTVKKLNNVVGVIKGKDSKKAVIVSAHFDHLGYVEGKLIRGALDNASGVSALIKIANGLQEKAKQKPFDGDIIFCAFNGEEEGLSGSRAFVEQITSKKLYDSIYNINIDSIGAKEGGKLALKNMSKVSNKLYDAVRTTLKKDNVEFADTRVEGAGDHLSFENAGISNVFFVQEGIEKLVHKPTDTPYILDYDKIDRIASSIVNFIETNNGVVFKD
ncbi:MAG: M20/M25/M40 family metallo-hydrolase [Clostridium luticellarii]|uniref:M20/M25/M40 family metallo-hydrolase n=1 Tax=Clostridium luticellarii TaxID=1691940 RepID=UPI00235257AC|nr:M20/M25/M40 family metallo-hydrolase [Clostridium luticellarii]MCI1996118.1 M20/M25/M40 family metallo-hydrolase [Clostridium luticellarii]MCI2040962.1 M20/M25/M40 family metallo-hydrolase [Clostridium luticellarii]